MSKEVFEIIPKLWLCLFSFYIVPFLFFIFTFLKKKLHMSPLLCLNNLSSAWLCLIKFSSTWKFCFNLGLLVNCSWLICDFVPNLLDGVICHVMNPIIVFCKTETRPNLPNLLSFILLRTKSAVCVSWLKWAIDI